VAFGLSAHSGWAALVVIGRRDGEVVVAGRRRIALVEGPRARQPYHAAEHMKPDAARDFVARCVDAVRRIAVREMRAAITHEREHDNTVTACAVLVGSPMPQWSVDEILAVHFRMHQAEGVLFRDVLVRASRECGVRLVAIPQKLLATHAAKALATPAGRLEKQIAALGKSVGPPWGKDQKDAALAALVALEGSTARSARSR
jgi:hypothetical protein